MVPTDRLSQLRMVAGFVIGETVLSGLLAAGLLVLVLLLLTGFDAEKLLPFLNNLTSRAVAADASRLERFVCGMVALWAALSIMVAAVRGFDRRFGRRHG